MLHMLEAAEKAVEFTEDMSEEQFLADERTVRAVVQLISVIGEAARHVDPKVQEQFDLEWHAVVAMRNHLVHGYYQIDMNRTYATVTEDLPPLIAALRAQLDESP
mgnify:CR=1 FL=1